MNPLYLAPLWSTVTKLFTIILPRFYEENIFISLRSDENKLFISSRCGEQPLYISTSCDEHFFS